MAIPSGSYRNSFGSHKPRPFPAAPPKSKRREIYTIVGQTLESVNAMRILEADSIETAVLDSTQPLQRFVFNNYKFIDGKLLPSNIKENYLYINGVYIKKTNYIVYEENTNLIAELTSWLGYRIEQNWTITIRIRTKST